MHITFEQDERRDTKASFVVEADVEAKYLCSDRLSHADSSAKETLAPSITYRLHTGSLFRKSLRKEKLLSLVTKSSFSSSCCNDKMNREFHESSL